MPGTDNLVTYSATSTLDPKKADVSTPGLLYVKMKAHWTLLEALLGGTSRMREDGKMWLPMEPKEEKAAYDARLRRSFLYTAYADTVDKLVAKPFARPITIDKIPKQLEELVDNTDRAGTDLTQLGKDMFRNGVIYGLTHVLVDFPRIEKGATLADERQVDARPVFISVTPRQLIGWRTVTLNNGQVRLTEVRIKETRVEPVGDWGEEENHYIRVYSVDTWELWKLVNQADKEPVWTLVDGGSHTFGDVPLVTFYTDREGFMVAKPPLEDLAWLNLAHYQSMSDQRNVLRFSRIGILFASGFTEEEVEKGIFIGPSQMTSSTNPMAKLQYVEHTGNAIKSGQEDLDKLEERMEVLGLQPLVARNNKSTATGKVIDESRSATDAQCWIRSLETAIEQCFLFAARWMNLAIVPDDIKVNIVDQFDLRASASTDASVLLQSAQANKLSTKTYLTEIKRRGLLADTLDVDEEVAAIDAQGPSLASLTGELARIGGGPQPAKPPAANKPPMPPMNMPGGV